MIRRINLLLVTKSTGGVASYIRALIRGLDKTKFNITVACLSENGAEFSEELKKNHEVDAFSLSMNRYRVNPITDAGTGFALARHIRKKRYDLIHAHASKPGFLTRLATIGTSIPVIYSPHNFAFHEGSSLLATWVVTQLERFAARFTTCIVAIANHERDLALQYGVGRPSLFEVIHTGIDPRVFREKIDVFEVKRGLGIPLNVPVVGAIGRLAAPKLPFDFIRAAYQLHNERPEIHFVWAGAGPLATEAQALSSSLGLNEVFHWLGERSDIPALLRIFDCLILPSKWEAFPLVILEAFAAGVPVIATNNLGTSEIIKNGYNGWLVPVGDINAMVQLSTEVLTGSDLVREVCKTGSRQIDEMYTFENMMAAIESVYEKSVRQHLDSDPPHWIKEKYTL